MALSTSDSEIFNTAAASAGVSHSESLRDNTVPGAGTGLTGALVVAGWVTALGVAGSLKDGTPVGVPRLVGMEAGAEEGFLDGAGLGVGAVATGATDGAGVVEGAGVAAAGLAEGAGLPAAGVGVGLLVAAGAAPPEGTPRRLVKIPAAPLMSGLVTLVAMAPLI